MSSLWQPVPFGGSFQLGDRWLSENPRDEAWRWIARRGTIEDARRICEGRKLPRDRAALVSARIRQGIELRHASREATLLTAPLLLYYALQNIARATIGFSRKEEPAAKHGLDFRPKGRDLLDAEAEVLSAGTFSPFVQLLGGTAVPGTRLTLRQVLASIPELLDTRESLSPSRVAMVRVRAFHGNERAATLRFTLADISAPELREQHASIFPSLAQVIKPTPQDFLFEVLTSPGTTYQEVASFLARHLLPDLRPRDDALWYCLRSDDGVPQLPRAAYYYLGAYILSNAVRYEPRLVADLNPDSSRLGWVLREFMDATDRYFPQLLVSIGQTHPIHFG